MLTPLHKYAPHTRWEVVAHTLASPAPDGTLAFYQESLSPSWHDGQVPFDDGVGRALCQYLMSKIIGRGLELSDGPYIQILEDDGSFPAGWIMLRAIIWTDEFDLLVSVEADASSGPEDAIR